MFVVSIVMATYNGAKFLHAQMDSILRQTYKDFEIVIVDDCSTDNTFEILQDYQTKYNNIKIKKSLENKGVTKTFECAINLCSGKYIAFCDQDDVWLPNKIERLMAEIGDNLLIHCDAKLVDENLRVIADSFALKYKDTTKNRFMDYLIGNNVTGCCVLVSTELLKLSMPIPSGFYIHDHYFALVASYYERIKYLPEQLILYRQHADNVMGATKVSYDKFLESSVQVGNSFDLLLSQKFVGYFKEIKLIRDYRLSVGSGGWSSGSSILSMAKFPRGWAYIIYFYLVTGFGSKIIGRFIYNKINGIGDNK